MKCCATHDGMYICMDNRSCEVTKDNMDQFVTSSGIRVSGNLHVFMGILHVIWANLFNATEVFMISIPFLF